MIEIKFVGTDNGVETDAKVQQAVAKFSKKTEKYKGEMFVEARYNDTHDAYCKVTGTGLKSPVVEGGKKVGEAVNGALGKVFDIISNKKQTSKDKKEQTRKTCAKRKAREQENEEALEL